MRLINTITFEQSEFTDETPQYAILSHTWGDEEVTFQDFHSGTCHDLRGYKKIEYLVEQAKAVGILFVWIDTACIDKSSSAELSEALNSMMQWYTDAEMCFAYLEDIESKGSLEASRWFSRGWTLQELIAPMKVHFFVKGWKYIGDKSALADQISRFTGIDVIVLRQEGAFRLFSVATRMSWASTRKTTRIEDMAYCLLGLFDINLPAVYGEGEKAFNRLQQEIIRNSSDETILAWNKNTSISSSGLASQPSIFKSDHNVVPLNPREQHRPSILTNRGLQMYVRISERLVTGGQPEAMAVLNCRFDRCFDGYVAIPLIQARASDTFYRKGTEPPQVLTAKAVQKLNWRTIYLDIASKPTPVLGIKRSPCVIRFSPEIVDCGYNVSHEEPDNARGSWSQVFRTSEVTYSPRETDKIVIRNFIIYSQRTHDAFLAILVTGYLDPDVKLFAKKIEYTEEVGSVSELIKSAIKSDFDGCLPVKSLLPLGIYAADKEICVELATEEMLETKVRVIDITTIPTPKHEQKDVK